MRGKKIKVEIKGNKNIEIKGNKNIEKGRSCLGQNSPGVRTAHN